MRAVDGLYQNFRWGFTGELQEMEVEGGRVVYRGPKKSEIPNPKSAIDLKGRWLLPAFIDAHCHVLPTGLDLGKLHLGKCSSREQVLDAVADRHKQLAEGKWLLAVHYDQTKFSDGGHLTLTDLDQATGGRPTILRHVNGHASVVNSEALRRAGISEDTPDPGGGTYRRDASGRLDGVLFEHAHEYVTAAVPNPTLEEMVEAILLAGEKMSELGIDCASDMMTGRFDLPMELEAYRLAAERGCKVRLRLYVQWGAVFGPRPIDTVTWLDAQRQMNPETCRIAGIKIFADGAIGSATAAIYGRYSEEA